MLSFLRKQLGAPHFDAPLAPERLVYAVGDVHGRVDKLDALLRAIEADVSRSATPFEVVLLGDYVDRGDHSQTVVERLMGLAARFGGPPVLLKGNHEQMLLDFIDSPPAGPLWLRNGGVETLMSYGVPVRGAEVRDEAELTDLRDRLVDAMGPHLDFLRRLSLTHRNGNLLFVHAAANPHLPPDAQPPATVLWGARETAARPRKDGIWVVHGHTVVDRPMAVQGRIAVDTGACYGGKLSAARIDRGELHFLSA